MSCFGESVYASLAQLSVQGQANELLKTHKVGELDVFSSAFFTHPSFASGFIRCGDIAQMTPEAGGNVVFQPPRSFDVVHDCFVLLELPGLVQLTADGKEVLPDGQNPRYTLSGKVNANQNGLETAGASLTTTADFGGVASPCTSIPNGLTLTDGTTTFTNNAGTWASSQALAAAAGADVSFTVTAFGAHAPHVYANTEDLAQYVYAAGQYAIQKCILEIGGSAIDEVTSEWLFINEELHGKVGRRLQDMILKVPGAMHTRSTIRNRLYVPMSFWFTGGDLSRALMTIALQLHRIDFRVTFRKLSELIANYNSTINVWTPGANGKRSGAATAKATTVSARNGEEVGRDTRTNFTNAVRASGANAQHVYFGGPAIGHELLAYVGAEFHGCFLNSTTRARSLKLQSQQLFFTVQEEVHQPTNNGEQNYKVPFKNAVFEIIAAVRSKGVFGATDPWKFGGTAADASTGLHDDALRRLSFSLSSTPRTLRNLEAQYYRTVTQFMTADTASDLKGLYYWPIMTREFLNGTRIVSSFINCSKIDDIRIQYQLNTADYNGNSLSKDNTSVHFFARAWNLLSIKNSMAGKMFQ